MRRSDLFPLAEIMMTSAGGLVMGAGGGSGQAESV